MPQQQPLTFTHINSPSISYVLPTRIDKNIYLCLLFFISWQDTCEDPMEKQSK